MTRRQWFASLFGLAYRPEQPPPAAPGPKFTRIYVAGDHFGVQSVNEIYAALNELYVRQPPRKWGK